MYTTHIYIYVANGIVGLGSQSLVRAAVRVLNLFGEGLCGHGFKGTLKELWPQLGRGEPMIPWS